MDVASLRETARFLDNLADQIAGEAGGSLHHPDQSRISASASPGLDENSALLTLAQREYQARRERDKILPNTFVGEPCWDMLLDLFICKLRNKNISITSVCMASQGPISTALRYVKGLESAGYITRSQSSSDNRVTYLELSGLGFLIMKSIMIKRLGFIAPLKEMSSMEKMIIEPSQIWQNQ
jgi:hypothetical protein